MPEPRVEGAPTSVLPCLCADPGPPFTSDCWPRAGIADHRKRRSAAGSPLGRPAPPWRQPQWASLLPAARGSCSAVGCPEPARGRAPVRRAARESAESTSLCPGGEGWGEGEKYGCTHRSLTASHSEIFPVKPRRRSRRGSTSFSIPAVVSFVEGRSPTSAR